ncbi:MAG: SRPBCC domain-containing protein [Actinomycetes bacterium]
MPATTSLAPLTKTILVPAPVDRAFELFTAGIGGWWPLRTHSVGENAAERVEMTCRVGGEIVETLRDGSTAVWGTVTAWAPPHRVAFTWHPGQAVAEATQVDVGFQEEGGQTRVTLVHAGWENRPDARQARQAYDTGWGVVLAPLAGAA